MLSWKPTLEKHAVLVTQNYLEAKELKSKLLNVYQNVSIVFVYDDTYLDEVARRLTPDSTIFLPTYDKDLYDEINSKFKNNIMREHDIQAPRLPRQHFVRIVDMKL